MRRFQLTALTLAMLQILPALSEESPELAEQNTAREIELITVTAQKREQASLQVPVSTQVVSGEELAIKEIADLQALSAQQPSFLASPNSSSSKLFMRGMGSQGNAGMDQAVSVYIDQVYHGRSRIIKGSLFDVEQLDILKGAQGTYFGLNTIAGALHLQTAKASLADEEGYLTLSAGSNNRLNGAMAYNQKLSENLALRTAVKVQQDDGHWHMVDPVAGEVADSGQRGQMLRLSTLWQVNPELQVQGKLEYQKQSRNNPFAWQPFGCDNLYGLGFSEQAQLNAFWQATGSDQDNPLRIPSTCRSNFSDNKLDHNSPASPFNQSEFEHLAATVNLVWQLDGVELFANTAFYDSDYGFSGNDLSHGASFHRIFWSSDNVRQWSQEIRLANSADSDLFWTIGAYWHQSDLGYQTADADGRNQQNPQWVHSQAWQDETRLSLFAATEWQFIPKWTLALGFRHSRTDKEFDGLDQRIRSQGMGAAAERFRQLLLADVSAAPINYSEFDRQTRAEFIAEQQDFSDNMPSVSLLYQLGDNWYSYYKWSKAKKAGGFNFRLNNISAEDLVYRPESVIANEIGLKGSAIDSALNLELVVFSSNYYNLQQNSNRGDDGVITGSRIRNVAKASSDGVELSASWQITQKLALDFTATALDAEFDSYLGADCTRLQAVVSRTDVAADFGAQRNGQSCSQDLSGKPLSHAPDHAGTLALSYDFSPMEGWNLGARAEAIWSDGFFTSPHADSLRYQSEYQKYNLLFTLSPPQPNWQFSLFIHNLTDKLTAHQLGQDGNAAVSGLVDPGKNWFLQAKYKL